MRLFVIWISGFRGVFLSIVDLSSAAHGLRSAFLVYNNGCMEPPVELAVVIKERITWFSDEIEFVIGTYQKLRYWYSSN